MLPDGGFFLLNSVGLVRQPADDRQGVSSSNLLSPTKIKCCRMVAFFY
jgi:hypothetical protein